VDEFVSLCVWGRQCQATPEPDRVREGCRVTISWGCAVQDMLALNMDMPSVMPAGRWKDTRMGRYGEKGSQDRAERCESLHFAVVVPNRFNVIAIRIQ
jgi:hypothetical protein